jgi:hypothetical protein
MAPDQRKRTANGQCGITGGSQPGEGYVDIHNADCIALLPIGRGKE